jgi:hypothetical protein
VNGVDDRLTERASNACRITWLNALDNYYNLINLPLEIESDGFCALAEARTAGTSLGQPSPSR